MWRFFVCITCISFWDISLLFGMSLYLWELLRVEAVGLGEGGAQSHLPSFVRQGEFSWVKTHHPRPAEGPSCTAKFSLHMGGGEKGGGGRGNRRQAQAGRLALRDTMRDMGTGVWLSLVRNGGAIAFDCEVPPLQNRPRGQFKEGAGWPYNCLPLFPVSPQSSPPPPHRSE